MKRNEAAQIALLAKRDVDAFEQVFKAYYRSLHGYACSLLQEEAMAEEMVQTVFLKLWERSENLSINGSLAAYLYRAMHNESLNYLKHKKVRAVHGLYVSYSSKGLGESASRGIYLKELETRLQKALSELPEQCRTIFQMSRFEELRYRDLSMLLVGGLLQQYRQ